MYDASMVDSVREFYDELAESYHLIFADWQGSMRRQAAALDRLIEAQLGPGPHAILDCACGIGTQAIGLALLGHAVHATDLSPNAVARAEREAATRDASLSFGVADMRALASQVDGRVRCRPRLRQRAAAPARGRRPASGG